MITTLETIQEAIKAGYNVTVIINGEYYEFGGVNNDSLNNAAVAD